MICVCTADNRKHRFLRHDDAYVHAPSYVSSHRALEWSVLLALTLIVKLTKDILFVFFQVCQWIWDAAATFNIKTLIFAELIGATWLELYVLLTSTLLRTRMLEREKSGCTGGRGRISQSSGTFFCGTDIAHAELLVRTFIGIREHVFSSSILKSYDLPYSSLCVWTW